jgi:hypothetical protein
MSIHKLIRACWIGVVGLSGLIAQAADTIVTNDWNVTPWNVIGPTLQTFESMPDWVIGTGNTNSGTGMPNRSDRFWTNEVASAGKRLLFSTLGITNTLSGAKIQPGTPIFVDMRCKIYPFGATPPTVAPNTIFCFYANQNSNLVVASSSPSAVTQCQTNTSITVMTNEYYSVMVRFASDTFDIFFANSTTPVLSLSASNTTQISKMVITGDGELDDLYISYGDPRRFLTNSLVSLGDGWSPSLTAEEAVVKNWLSNHATSGTYSKASAEKFYLINATNSVADVNFEGELGIGSIDYNPASTSVTVVVTLKTGASASTKKSGKINGVLKLKGATDYNDAKNGTWSSGVLASTIIQSEDFANGVATYTFQLQTANNKFFLPIIQSNIQ